MALTKKGKWRYGDSQADIREEVVRYSKRGEGEAVQFADAVCECGAKTFRLDLDEGEGVAVRTCSECFADRHPIADGAELLAEAELETCACPCGAETFEITIGVALYDDSEEVRRLYIGGRCPTCGLTAVYGDWSCEGGPYPELLRKV